MTSRTSVTANEATLLQAALMRGGNAALTRLFGIALGIALLTAGAKISVPFWPVPMTMQTFAVLIVGASLGRAAGAASVLGYLGLGAAGLPVFAGIAAGPAYLMGPTAGYLLGFVMAAACIGWIAERKVERRMLTLTLGGIAAMALIYACGAGWLALQIGAQKAWAVGVLPFLLGDALKIGLAALLLRGLERVARRA
jgi:biotin transport system substrate-specific component